MTLQVEAGSHEADLTGCVTVYFRWLDGGTPTPWVACSVFMPAARFDNYLRSLVKFMRWKVGPR